jgi:hypothetical protein
MTNSGEDNFTSEVQASQRLTFVGGSKEIISRDKGIDSRDKEKRGRA